MPRQKQEEKFEVLKISDDEVKEFERKLGDYRQSDLSEQPKELSFYGLPLQNQERFSGYVCTELLGAVHFSVVKYCLDKGIIKKYSNGIFSWLIAYEDFKVGLAEHTRILDCPYKEFMPRWKALKDLKNRRHFAEDKESERLGMPVNNRISKILDEQKPNIGVIFSKQDENKEFIKETGTPDTELERIEKLAEKEEILESDLGF